MDPRIETCCTNTAENLKTAKTTNRSVVDKAMIKNAPIYYMLRP